MDLERKTELESFLKLRDGLQSETCRTCFPEQRVVSSDELRKEEEKACMILKRLVKANQYINPSEYFLENIDKYSQSSVFCFLRHMPKGAHLHTHGIATGDFKKLAKYIVKQENLYMWVGSNTELYTYGVFKYFKSISVEENSYWRRCSELSCEFVYELITMPKAPAPDDKLSPRPWADFQSLWLRIRFLARCIPVWSGRNSFLWTILEDQYRAGVLYIEFREVMSDDFFDPYDRVDADVFVRAFADTVELFKQENPGFLGAKLICCAIKVETPQQVRKDILLVIQLKDMFPDVIAGYDLIGEEDSLNQLSDYAEELVFCKMHGMPLLLHAGETSQTSTSTQLYDAVSVQSRRIGHGYDLINHPPLLKKVIEDEIVIECCPISNQVLGYCSDLKNHNGKTMLRHGVKMTVNSDDAGMFHYNDPTYDWTAIVVAWGLDLFQIKHLARQSFQCSTLDEETVSVAEKQFDSIWEGYIRKILREYSEVLEWE